MWGKVSDTGGERDPPYIEIRIWSCEDQEHREYEYRVRPDTMASDEGLYAFYQNGEIADLVSPRSKPLEAEDNEYVSEIYTGILRNDKGPDSTPASHRK